MAKKKSSWINALIIGTVLGAASQHVPEIRTHTQKLGAHLTKNIENYVALDKLQNIVLKKRWKR
jgi:hypothetical protein